MSSQVVQNIRASIEKGQDAMTSALHALEIVRLEETRARSAGIEIVWARHAAADVLEANLIYLGQLCRRSVDYDELDQIKTVIGTNIFHGSLPQPDPCDDALYARLTAILGRYKTRAPHLFGSDESYIQNMVATLKAGRDAVIRVAPACVAAGEDLRAVQARVKDAQTAYDHAVNVLRRRCISALAIDPDHPDAEQVETMLKTRDVGRLPDEVFANHLDAIVFPHVTPYDS